MAHGYTVSEHKYGTPSKEHYGNGVKYANVMNLIYDFKEF